MHKKWDFGELDVIETSTHNKDSTLEHILILDKKVWTSNSGSLRMRQILTFHRDNSLYSLIA